MTSQSRARTIFIAAMLLLLLTGVFGATTLVRLRSSQAWVSHSRDVEKGLAQVNFQGARAAQFRAAYLDTGDPNDLQSYRSATALMVESARAVEQLTADNPAQRADARELQVVVGRRVQVMDEAVSQRGNGHLGPEQRAKLNRDLVTALAANNDTVERMATEEQRLLGDRISHARRSFWLTVITLASVFVSSLVLFFLYARMLNTELQARNRAEASLRSLTARLLQIQDDERRRFSRELHDSIGQYLAAVKMNLSLLGQTMPENSTLTEVNELIDKAGAETRTISYLLHPPLLDETGLPSAVKWYIDGFVRRSGIQIETDFSPDLGRLPSPIEIALFRVIQEALTNIHRHAQTDRAAIKLTRSGGSVLLRIRDFGRGISARALERFRSNSGPTGVGLAGMRERIAELGGQLEISSDSNGTQIVATVPVRPMAAQALASD